MQLKDIMTRNVEIVDPGTTIDAVARKMRDLDVGSFPVGENDRLVGWITDRDIALRAVADDRNPKTCTVRDCMSTGINWCYEDEDVSEAAHLMEEKQIRRLPILNRQKRLVGIVSLADLALGAGKALAGEAIREISRAH